MSPVAPTLAWVSAVPCVSVHAPTILVAVVLPLVVRIVPFMYVAVVHPLIPTISPVVKVLVTFPVNTLDVIENVVWAAPCSAAGTLEFCPANLLIANCDVVELGKKLVELATTVRDTGKVTQLEMLSHN